MNGNKMLYMTCDCEVCGSKCTLTTPEIWRGDDTVPCGVCGYNRSKATDIKELLTDEMKTDTVSIDN